MGDPAVILCGSCAQRNPGAPAVKCVCLQSCLSHSLSRRNLSCPPARNHPFEVIRQRHRFAADVFTLLLGDSNSFALTLQDVLPLKFRDCGEHGEHKLAGRRSRIDSLFAADELDLLLGQPFYKVEQVARVSRKSADGLDNNRVAATACAIQRCCRK